MTSDQASTLRAMVEGGSWSLTDAAHAAGIPAEVLEQEPLSAKGARVLAITSGKGGVGKSNIAVNVAVQLAKQGRRVALMDADLGLANADVLCGVTAMTNLAHVVAGRRELADAMIKGPGGFTLIPGASGLAQMAGLSEFERYRLIQLFRQLSAGHDALIVDTGAGIGPVVLDFIVAADQIMVVSTPEPTSITDAYALIKVARRRRPDASISLCVNMAHDEEEARRVHDRIAAVCRRFLGFSPEPAGYILLDPAVNRAVRAQKPFVLAEPNASSSLCIQRLAHKLDRSLRSAGAGGFLRRVSTWLAG